MPQIGRVLIDQDKGGRGGNAFVTDGQGEDGASAKVLEFEGPLEP
jgi:hypothetical protein